MKRWYVGIKNGSRTVFQSDTMPTQERYSGQYLAVIGPFKTKRAALWACEQHNNPHFQTVNDAERISKQEA